MIDIDAAPWRTGLATAAGYGVLLVALFVALFVVPYLVAVAL